MKLWEVQGSYWSAPDEGKRGYRANRRAFVIADSAEAAIALWHQTTDAGQREIHQVICRTNHNTDLILDLERDVE